MNRSLLPRLGSTTLSIRIGAVVAVSAAAVAGLGAAPAQSAPQDPCPPPATVAVGDAVHGLTVSSGTTADTFDGTVLGTLSDGIAPGIDMVMVRLSSPEIDRVGGIWEGMSGSPVYDADGNLVGAVAYGLSTGPSPVAGVTPAADMEDLLTPGGGATALPRFRSHVALGKALQQRLVASGAATRAEAGSGLSQLKLPFSISGVSGARRVAQVSKLFKLPNLRSVPSGGGSALTPGDPSGIFPGSNLAASMSYGDVTSAGIGTTTAVCGDQVLAFGHPFTFTGPSTMTLHTADALYVQEDPTLAPFKLANLTGEVGEITGDHLAGIDGVLGIGKAPTPWDVTSTVGLSGSAKPPRTGTTHITVQDYFSDLATTHLLADQDRVLDSYGKGESTLTWTITGTRENGTPFTLHRTDKYADSYDISYDTGFALYDVLSALQYNRFENITLTGVTTSSTISRNYSHYSMRRLERLTGGAWHRVNLNRTIRARVGKDIKLRVMLVSADHTDHWRRVDVRMPAHARHRYGYLEVFGGGSGQGGDGFYYGRSAAGSSPFDQLLARLNHRPHNTQVVSDVVIQNDNGRTIARRETRHDVGDVVGGDFEVSVVGVR